jgi:hypothetical protein
MPVRLAAPVRPMRSAWPARQARPSTRARAPRHPRGGAMWPPRVRPVWLWAPRRACPATRVRGPRHPRRGAVWRPPPARPATRFRGPRHPRRGVMRRHCLLGDLWAPQRPRLRTRTSLRSRPRCSTLPRPGRADRTTPSELRVGPAEGGSPGRGPQRVVGCRVVLDRRRMVDGMIDGDMVLDLVATDEPEFAVRAVMHVAHGVQCRAATFPAGGIDVTIGFRHAGRERGHLRWASVTVGWRS